MTKGIFITATGTDIGKTYISALIVKKMRDGGYNCGYYKPVLSGAEIKNGKIYAGDCEYVKSRANLSGNAEDFASYIFKPAVSPHLAAIMENNPIKLEKIKNDFNNIKSKYDYILVEGAGGIVCPFDLSGDKPILTEDIIKALGLSVIIVSKSSLGSINSAVTTVEYAINHSININGLILNQYDKTDFMQADNKKQIKKLTDLSVVAAVKQGDTDLDIDIKILENLFKEIQ